MFPETLFNKATWLEHHPGGGTDYYVMWQRNWRTAIGDNRVPHFLKVPALFRVFELGHRRVMHIVLTYVYSDESPT